MVVKMTGDIYEKIREENLIKYGTAIDNYGPRLLSDLYSDGTHFIYELLQNAEDAYERGKRAGTVNEFSISFRLLPDRLEVRHNGILFDEKDINGICGLVEGTKSDDSSQIGKFGIGFKSVYAYTKSPEIYSGNESFYIENYVHPCSIEPRGDVGDGETLFVIPFNHNEVTKEIAFSEIKDRLKNLGLRTLLFLRNIEEISWSVDLSSGKYSRSSKTNNVNKWINLFYEDGGNTKEHEKWLVFEKPIHGDRENSLKVEVAYLLNKDNKTNRERIVSAHDTKLVAFFPTKKETYLNFLIQAPYETTTARENIIHGSGWNENLIEETAILVAESISKAKEMNLLDVSYLNTLPIESDYLSEENPIFKLIYEKVREKLLSDEALLPVYDREYTSSKQALIIRGKDLRDLLSSEQLEMLFNRTKWLDENITDDKHPVLRKYLMEKLDIAEIDPERFAREFTKDFIEKQSDEWVKRFYVFLVKQEALWKKKTYSREKEGILRSKPIIRLKDDSHTRPFDYRGKPLAYLPSTNRSINKLFQIVKESIIHDPEAKEFLQKIGLTEPNAIAGVMNIILPKYQNDSITETDEENKQHVEWISKTLKSESPSDTRRMELLRALKGTPFLWANNIANSQSGYKKPAEIHLGEIYTGNKDLEIYFEGNDNIWFLDERYLKVIDVSALEDVRCKAEIQVDYKMYSLQDGHVILVDQNGKHVRGLDGFDPDCEIEGLEYTLEHISCDRAKITWGILKKHYKKIHGVVETCARQDFSRLTEEDKKSKFSKMGDLLSRYSWIPDIEGEFHKSSEILLSELPEEFDKESLEAKSVAEKLKFKTDAEQQILEQLPIEKRKRYEMVDKLYQNMPEGKVNGILEKLIKQIDDHPIQDFPIQDMVTKIKESLVTIEPPPTDNTQGEGWSGLSIEDEERTREKYPPPGRPELTKEPRVEIDTIISGSIDPKEFLFVEYDGHCQICNNRLDLGGDKRPYFDIFRMVEIRGENRWSNMEFNVLCLCPNCHALLKHGGRDLSNVLEVANKLSKGEIAPEPVNERRGDFYIVKIGVVGKGKELFYSPAHINKFAAFIEQSTHSVKEEE